MGAGASSSNGLSYAAGGADVSAEASGAGADAYDAVHDPMSEDARAGSAGEKVDAAEDLNVAQETVQMIFDILDQGSDEVDTVIETARALANHSHTAALLMSSQRDKRTGDTLLHAAVRGGEFDIVGVLLTDHFRFDINAQNWKGAAPLHVACTSGSNSAGIAEVLIQHHAWVDAQDAEGSTPLIFAAAAGDEECIRTLLDAGASLECCDVHGYTALDWATHYCHVGAVKALGGGELNEWVQYYDDNTQMPYWYNTRTNESVWEMPEGANDAPLDVIDPHHEMPSGSGSVEAANTAEAKESAVPADDESLASPSLTDRWRRVAWRIGRARVALKTDVPKLRKSPSRRGMFSPAPPRTPSMRRTPSSSPHSRQRHLPGTPGSPSAPSTNVLAEENPHPGMMSPGQGARIHSQIESLMKMQQEMQAEMRRRLTTPTVNNSSSGIGANLAAIEEQRVAELEQLLRDKDEELRALKLKRTNSGDTSAADGGETSHDGGGSEDDPDGHATSEAALLAARQEVEDELAKQRKSAEEAKRKEETAKEAERAAMEKVESMMKEL
eukprot:g751.t1